MSVVVPLLATPEGKEAVSCAVDEARRQGSVLYVVGFVPNPGRTEAAGTYASERADNEAALAREVERIGASGVRCEGRAPVGVGRLSAAVLEVADEVGAEQIVIGIRRRSRVGKIVLGSDAQDILLKADCDVLAVKVPVASEHG
jgi:nucleotide-binding universal stress UspA family protein